MKEIIPFSKEIVFSNNIAVITSISLEHEEKVYSGEIAGDFIILGEYKTHNDTTEVEPFKYRLPFNAILPDTIDYDTITLDIVDFTYNQIENDVIKVNIDFSISAQEQEPVTYNDINFESISNLEEKRQKEVSLDEELDEFLEQYNQPAISEEEEELNEQLEESETSNPEYELEQRQNTEENNNNINIIKNAVPIIGNKITFNNKPEETTIINDAPVQTEEEKKPKPTESDPREEYVTYHIHIMKQDETLESLVAKYNGNIEVVKEINQDKKFIAGDKIIIPEYKDE